MQQILTQTTGEDPTTYQDLGYTAYDRNGNLLTIEDWVNGTPEPLAPQVLLFTYHNPGTGAFHGCLKTAGCAATRHRSHPWVLTSNPGVSHLTNLLTADPFFLLTHLSPLQSPSG